MKQELETQRAASVLNVTSPAFAPMGFIPEKYTCDGINVNPPLEIAGIPEAAKCLALIVDDPDAPSGNWDHWVVWNIPPQSRIAENTVPGAEGLNDFGRCHYGGPCPPSGIHRYFFKVYALEHFLELPAGSDKTSVEKAMERHIIARGELIGRYKRL